MASVRFDRVSKLFGSTVAVDDLSIDVADGEFLVLVGPSGCGKTTALRMLAGLEDLSSGQLFVGDRLVNNLTPSARDIAMVFQSYALYPHMSVRENLGFNLRIKRLQREEITRRVEAAAEVLELGHLLERKPRELSGGQRQRVALGRAIVREPVAFLMDEPLSNLDAALRVQTRAEILKLQERLQTTTVYVTHDQVEAMTMGDRIAVMRNGVLQQIGTPQALYTSPANTFVASFIGSPSMNLLPTAAIGINRPGTVVGFRPEHVQLGNGHEGVATYEAIVEVVEYLGDEQLAHIRVGDAHLVVKLAADAPIQTGRAATFSVPYERLVFFDETTEEATPRGV